MFKEGGVSTRGGLQKKKKPIWDKRGAVKEITHRDSLSRPRRKNS